MARSRLIASTVMLMVALTVATPASASERLTGTGTGTIAVRSITTIRHAGGNIIQTRELAGTVTGALTGTFVEHVRGVIHPNGLVTFEGTITFTGTVADCGSGTLTLGLSGRGVTGAPVTESHVRVIDTASNTIDVDGHGTLSQNGPALTYEVTYGC